MRRAARERTDSVFGNVGSARKSKSQFSGTNVKSSGIKGNSFNAQAKEPSCKQASSDTTFKEIKCYDCSGNHALSECKVFSKTSPAARLDKVKQL